MHVCTCMNSVKKRLVFNVLFGKREKRKVSGGKVGQIMKPPSKGLGHSAVYQNIFSFRKREQVVKEISTSTQRLNVFERNDMKATHCFNSLFSITRV